MRVDDVRVFRIDACLETVTAADGVPVTRADATSVQRARRAADGAVVLGAAADAIERPRVVRVDPVEL